MTREVPEWIGARDDTPAPPRVKARIVAAQEGVCGCGCGVKLGLCGERIEFDHTTALILGGENREGNLRALRAGCHRHKTDADVRQKSIEARKRAKHLGIASDRRAIIPGSKGSRFKKKLNGAVEWR